MSLNPEIERKADKILIGLAKEEADREALVDYWHKCLRAGICPDCGAHLRYTEKWEWGHAMYRVCSVCHPPDPEMKALLEVDPPSPPLPWWLKWVVGMGLLLSLIGSF